MVIFEAPFQRYENCEAFYLYMELEELEENRMDFQIPEDTVVTCEMMRAFLKAAHLAMGYEMPYDM